MGHHQGRGESGHTRDQRALFRGDIGGKFNLRGIGASAAARSRGEEPSINQRGAPGSALPSSDRALVLSPTWVACFDSRRLNAFHRGGTLHLVLGDAAPARAMPPNTTPANTSAAVPQKAMRRVGGSSRLVSAQMPR